MAPQQMGDDEPGNLVWYAAYGSNMARERLRCYLEGSRPRGGRRTERGARDPSPPRASRAVRLPLQLRFAGRSTVWGGGKAFVTPADGRRCLARAWLLHRRQFEDLACQESGRATRAIAVEEICPVNGLAVGAGHYDRILRCGDLDGFPVVTFTSPRRPPRRAPAPAYLRMLARGLGEAHGFTPERVASYLAAAEGVEHSPGELVALLQE